jgi:protein-S-isoprenylcysteine O-methyltransferase Ste14
MLYAGFSYVVRFDAAPGHWADAASLRAAGVDVALFSLFALHHSILIRAGVKPYVAAIVGPALERTTYVVVASALLAAVVAGWQPAAGVLWAVDGAIGIGLAALQVLGVILTAQAAGRIGFLDLAGVRQAFGHATTRPTTLTTRGAYRFVRHPIYFAWLLMVWPTPVMTGTRLVFAAVSTLYLMAAIPFEERDLTRTFGPAYAAYRRDVRWRLVPFLY